LDRQEWVAVHRTVDCVRNLERGRDGLPPDERCGYLRSFSLKQSDEYRLFQILLFVCRPILSKSQRTELIARSIRSQYRKTDIYISDISSRNFRRGHTLLVERIPKHHLLRMVHTLYLVVVVSEALTYLSWFAYNTSHESRITPEDLTVWHIHFLPILFCLDAYTP
jgi:hypothetical protein